MGAFPEGETERGTPYESLRWSRFKNFEAKSMFAVVSDEVFPFIRGLGASILHEPRP